MADPVTSGARRVTWEQGRQEQRDDWGRMTMAERLASSISLFEDMSGIRGILSNESQTDGGVVRITHRKR